MISELVRADVAALVDQARRTHDPRCVVKVPRVTRRRGLRAHSAGSTNPD
jgi:hypothetical protein